MDPAKEKASNAPTNVTWISGGMPLSFMPKVGPDHLGPKYAVEQHGYRDNQRGHSPFYKNRLPKDINSKSQHENRRHDLEIIPPP